jgi:hypothetical protein
MTRFRGRALQSVGIQIVVAIAVAGAAGLIVGKYQVAAVGVVGAVVAFGLVALVNRGVVAGLLVLGIENGIPGVDVANLNIGGGGAVTSGLVAVLIAVLLVPPLLGQVEGVHDPILRRRLFIVAGALAAWWAITLVRSQLDGIPLITAATYAREFLIVAILLPLSYLSLRDPRLARGFLATLVAGAIPYALGQILKTLAGVQLSWLVHSVAVVSDSGVARVYASMAEVVHVTFALALGAVLLHTSTRVRVLAGVVAGVCLVSMAAELARAVYLGILVGLILVSVYWLAHAGQKTFRKHAARVVGGLVLAGVIAAFAVPSLTSNQLVTTATARVQSGFTETSAQSGNVGLRFTLYRDMLPLLGNRLPVGLGFLDPRYHYYVDLPNGDIRNSDVGVMNAVMTMGLIGAGLIYLLVGVCLSRMLAVARRPLGSQGGDEWMAFGMAVWLVGAIATSFTLVTLFGLSGLVLVGTVGGVVLHATPAIAPLPRRRAAARAGLALQTTSNRRPLEPARPGR